MAKRRIEDSLLLDSPSKKCCRSLSNVDTQLGGMHPSGGVSPPSLVALLGSRCRKRTHFLEDLEKQEDELAIYLKPTRCEARKHAAHISTVQTSGSFHERHISTTPTSSRKRAREDCASPESAVPKSTDKTDEDTTVEDCTYNSFQYWRVPLPELDLSLLEDTGGNSQTPNKSKVKDLSFDYMESWRWSVQWLCITLIWKSEFKMRCFSADRIRRILGLLKCLKGRWKNLPSPCQRDAGSIKRLLCWCKLKKGY